MGKIKIFTYHFLYCSLFLILFFLPSGVKANAGDFFPPLPEARKDHEMIAINDKLYVIGGEDTQAQFKNTIFYSPGSPWRRAFLPEPLSNMGVITHDDKIFILGGYNGSYNSIKPLSYPTFP